MSTDLQSALELIQQYNYASIVVITAVGYDCIITFSREIDYVWCKPFTWVTALFFVVRYVGLCWAIMLVLLGSAFIPGPVKTYAPDLHTILCKRTFLHFGVSESGTGHYSKGTMLSQASYWGFGFFLAAADLVMILRVYAMWSKSKRILYTLLFIHLSQIIITFVWGIYTNTDDTLVTIVHLPGFTHCAYSYNITPSLLSYREIPRFILGTSLLILAVIPTLKQSIEMYNSTHHCQITSTMERLIREGVLYFVLILIFNVHELIQPGTPTVASNLHLDALTYPLVCAIMPRFIIGIRESCERDLVERWQGIDSGFGVRSQLASASGVGAGDGQNGGGPGEARVVDGEAVQQV